MSEIINDLKQLSQMQWEREESVAERAPEVTAGTKPSGSEKKGKGTVVLGGLITLLIGISVVSMSTSLKISGELEKSENGARATLQALHLQGTELRALKDLVMAVGEDGKNQMTGLKEQIRALKAAMEERDDKLSEVTVAHNALKKSIDATIESLESTDKVLNKKYQTLSDKINQLQASSPLFYNVN